MVEEICRQYREDLDNGLPVVPVSFNLSRLDFQMCDVVSFLREVTEKYQVPPSALHVEITETTFADDDGMISEAIDKLHADGYEVWMDDFGSGYSSLNSLKDYEFDQLKIDMAFLRSFTDRSKKIITSIVQMAKTIGIHTLIEGVETEEHYDFVREIGCEKVQGYFYGKPLPLRESEDQLKVKGIGAESEEDAEFLAEAGISLLSTQEPYAIIERANGHSHYMYMNNDYLTVLKNVGMETADDVIGSLNNDNVVNQARFLERVSQAIENDGFLHFAFPIRGHYVMVSIQILNNDGDRVCLKMTLSNTIIDAPEKSAEDTAEANAQEASSGGREESGSGEEAEETVKDTVLIVDDEPINFMLLSEMLRDSYNIEYAENGAKAVEILQEKANEISAVLLDMVMPVMDGMEVLKRIKGDPATRFIPVLVMTSATDMQEDILIEGASQFMPKPFEAPEIILAKVANVIESAEKVKGYSFRSMENLPGGVFIYKAYGNEQLLYANKQTLEIFECETMEELLELTGGTFKGIVHPDEYERIEAEIARQIAANEMKRDHVDYRIITKNGEIHHIDEFGQLVDDEVLGRVFYVFIGETYKGEKLAK